MKARVVLFAVVLSAATVGCSRFQPQAGGRTGAPSPVAQPDASKLEGLVLARKPAGAISVREARTRPEGETVVVSGQVPTEKVKPYDPAAAAVVMLDPEDMAADEVKEEFDCDHAATCSACKKLLDRLAVQVELVDPAGAPVATTLHGFRGLKPGSTITVAGEVRREGQKRVRIVATKFFPE